jgi:hypothetical protein
MPKVRRGNFHKGVSDLRRECVGTSYRSVNALQPAHSGPLAGRPLGSLRRDPMVAQMTDECLAPFAECRLTDIEAFAVVALGPDDNVHVRVGFIGVKSQGIRAYRCLGAYSSSAKSRTAARSLSGGVPAGIEKMILCTNFVGFLRSPHRWVTRQVSSSVSVRPWTY